MAEAMLIHRDCGNERSSMKIPLKANRQSGKVGWLVLWLLGVPVPILLILFLARGCT